MRLFYVAIEKNAESFEMYKALWQAHNIYGIMAKTMSEGIEMAVEIEKSNTDELFFISIVADDIDFLPQLQCLADETNAPILVATSKSRYTEKEHHAALSGGADYYATYADKPETDINGVFSTIRSMSQRAKKQKTPSEIITHGDILMVVNRHKVFVKDKELLLTGTEMKILHYLLLNRGNVLTHGQIYRNVYDDYEDISADSLYSAIKRIRKKMRDITHTEYIETVRDVGYRMSIK
jgi:DNA-binding response OmpR family regulator